MRFQKGQSVVEFALVLPFFFILVFGTIYFGFVFADYLSLSNIARSSAREASVADDEYYKDDYAKVREKYNKAELPLDFYTWEPTSTENFSIKYDSDNQNVVVTMYAPLNANGSNIAGIVNKLGNVTNTNFDLNITYTMYSENKH